MCVVVAVSVGSGMCVNCSDRSWVNGYGEVGEGREEVGGFDKKLFGGFGQF